MRAFGFALVVIGACVIYLGWKGKIGAALTAIWTGTPPTGTTNTSTASINKQTYKAANPTVSPQQNLNGQHAGAGFGPGGIING